MLAGLGWGSGDEKAAGANRAGMKQPHRAVIPGDCGREGNAGGTEVGEDGLRGYGVRKDGGEPGGEWLDIERAPID